MSNIQFLTVRRRHSFLDRARSLRKSNQTSDDTTQNPLGDQGMACPLVFAHLNPIGFANRLPASGIGI